MKRIIIYLFCLLSASCVSVPNFDTVRGNNKQRIAIAGASFIPSGDMVWIIEKHHTYQATLFNRYQDETLAIALETFNLSNETDKENFLSFIKEQDKQSPKTGRFERLNQSFEPYNHQNAQCVKHIASSKDYGAKRDGEYTIFEVYGMYCIHPHNNDIGIFIQLSRKAPFSQKTELLNTWGQDLLDSVVFKPYKI